MRCRAPGPGRTSSGSRVPVRGSAVDPFPGAPVLGNRATARLVRPAKSEAKPGGGAEKLVDGGRAGRAVAVPEVRPAVRAPRRRAPTAPSTGPPAPSGPAWRAGLHVVPRFSVTEIEGPRSNTDPATTDVDTPTFTGGVAVDAAAGVWRYQIRSVTGTGRITFVYYTSDHYPAPTPNDDAGDLTNVTRANWKDVASDLETHKEGVAGDWSAYRRTILHERYHWRTEWQTSVRKRLGPAEDDIAKDGVSFATAADAATAEGTLAPRAETTFAAAMAAARADYDALGDSAGDPPYKAGSRGATALAARVRRYAAAKKW